MTQLTKRSIQSHVASSARDLQQGMPHLPLLRNHYQLTVADRLYKFSIPLHLAAHRHDWHFVGLKSAARASQGVKDLATLRALRLTSRSYHPAATRVLFHAAIVTWSVTRQNEPRLYPSNERALLAGNTLPVLHLVRYV